MTASDTARLMTLCADRLTAHPDTAQENHMTELNAPGFLRATAADYERHGANTRSILEGDWSGEPAGTSYGPKVTTSTHGSSAVERHVVSTEIAIEKHNERMEATKIPSMHPAALLHRWNEACRQFGHKDEFVAEGLRLEADSWGQGGALVRSIVMDAAHELTDIINLCRPIHPDVAAKLTRLSSPGGYCRVCECPLKPGEARGSKCDADRKLQKRWIESGRVEAADEAAFRQAVVDDISRGVLHRPASPYWPVGRQWVPEEAM